MIFLLIFLFCFIFSLWNSNFQTYDTPKTKKDQRWERGWRGGGQRVGRGCDVMRATGSFLLFFSFLFFSSNWNQFKAAKEEKTKQQQLTQIKNESIKTKRIEMKLFLFYLAMNYFLLFFSSNLGCFNVEIVVRPDGVY